MKRQINFNDTVVAFPANYGRYLDIMGMPAIDGIPRTDKGFILTATTIQKDEYQTFWMSKEDFSNIGIECKLKHMVIPMIDKARVVSVVPMTSTEYKLMRGWDTSEDVEVDGSLVMYDDDDTTPATWFPKIGTKNLHSIGNHGLDFSSTLMAVNAGYTATRNAWKTGNCITKVDSSYSSDGREIKYNAYILKRIGDHKYEPWTPTNTDLFSDDWYLI